MDAKRVRELRQRRRNYEQRARRGLRGLLDRLLRRRVLAGSLPDRPDDWGEPGGGSAGVREPRHPGPPDPKPQSGAGARPLPREEQSVRMRDPRQ